MTDAGQPGDGMTGLHTADGSQEQSQAPGQDDRRTRVLRELAKEDEATVAFQGLKRTLGLHQQQLARTLTRLEEDGLIEADAEGYRLSETGYDVLAGGQATGPRCPDRPLVQALLPPSLDDQDVAEALAQRWFKGLRWYGRTSGPGETTLIWLTEADQRTLRLRLNGSTFTVTTDGCGQLDAATFQAVYRLVTAVTALYDTDAASAA